MMKRVFLLCCLGLTSIQMAPAIAAPVTQKAQPAQVNSKVVERRAMPPEILKQVPAEGTSRFYGVTPLKVDGQPVFVHLYDTAKTNFDGPQTDEDLKDYNPASKAIEKEARRSDTVGIQPVEVDLYVFRPTSSRYEKIISVQFQYVRERARNGENIGISESINVRTLWLDEKTQHIPILKFSFSVPGFRADMGSTMLLIFPDGLRGKSIVEGFAFGASNSGGGEEWSCSFDKTDKNGNLLITSHWSTPYGGSEGTLFWNGQHFAFDKKSGKNVRE